MKEKITSGELHFKHFESRGTYTIINMVNYVMAELPFRTEYSLKIWGNDAYFTILKGKDLMMRANYALLYCLKHISTTIKNSGAKKL